MAEKKLITNEIYQKLIAPMPPESISKHPTKSYLSTIKAIYVVERLNHVFGVGRWNFEHTIVKETEDFILVRGKLILLDYDCVIPEQYGGHMIQRTNIDYADGYKSAVTDALSKTASYIGIGLDVFKGLVKPPVQKNTQYKKKNANINEENTNYNDEKLKKANVPIQDNKRNNQVTYISERILEMTKDNYDDAANMLQLLSQFTNKDGILIQGFASFKTMIQNASDRRIEIIYHNTKKEYENYIKKG